jgi:hypothetical protein
MSTITIHESKRIVRPLSITLDHVLRLPMATARLADQAVSEKK